jgi:hypothetical protein
MKNLSWLILILALYSCKDIKVYPDKLTITRIADSILKKCWAADDTTKKIKFIKGHFTDQNSEECLALIPMIDLHHITPILFNKISDDWKYANWFWLETDSLSVVDIDNDNINEILLYFARYDSGMPEYFQSLISLKDKKVKYLYKNEGFYDNHFVYPFKDAGNHTISVKYLLKIEDRDNDGKKEIEEKKTIGYPDKVVNEKLILKFIVQTKIIKIK